MANKPKPFEFAVEPRRQRHVDLLQRLEAEQRMKATRDLLMLVRRIGATPGLRIVAGRGNVHCDKVALGIDRHATLVGSTSQRVA
jgi:hypothetical protein